MSVYAAAPPPITNPTFNPFHESNNPRAIVAIDGNRYIPRSYSITFNAHGATDEATVTLPISSNPDFSVEFYRPPSSASAPAYVQIYSGFPLDPVPGSMDTSALSSRFYGIIDLYHAQFDRDEITFSCRSLAAPLVDNKVTSYVAAQDSHQFAQACADYVGLQLDYRLNPGTTAVTLQEMLGREFISGSQFNAALYNQRYWDVLMQLAQFDDVDVWVDETALHYVAPGLIARTTIPLAYGTDVATIANSHAIQFSKNVQVEVRTYQKRVRQSTTTRINSVPGGGVSMTQSSKTITSSPSFGTSGLVTTTISPTGVSTTASSTTGGSYSSGLTSPGSESGKERYIFYIPNLTPARANQIALAKWRQISMHEYGLHLEIPVTKAHFAAMDVTALLSISGLPYQYANDTYWPRQITETMDAHDGFRWAIIGLNHEPPKGGV